jgi:hypothetical protein
MRESDLRNWNTDKNSADRGGLSSFTRLCTSHLAPHPATVNPPPPPHAAPHPFSTSTHASRTPTVKTPRQDAVTSDTMCNWELIQCAAAMWVIRVANTSSDSKVTATGHQMPSIPPSDSPFRSRSYVTFVTDQELQQARADLEECFRCRARRAGLEESLPADRPMTEEEIEDLQWQLGDFGPANGHGSRGKKRSKEVIDMTIEEMEAEIQETNEAIRKRRRKSLGLMLKPLWLLTAFACLMRSPVAAFTAYDCSNRSSVVESYSLLQTDACANMGRDGEVEMTVYGEIVQIKQDRMILVFRCTVIETLVAQYCGMFSAAGVTRYLKFRELKPLEAWECWKAKKNSLLLIDGRPISGRIGATVSHTMFLAGDLDDESTARWAR